MPSHTDTSSTDLRKKIYSQYGHDFQDAPDVFDRDGATRWGKAYKWYLRDWLPSKSSSNIAELACGNGFLLHLLQSLGYSNLRGVDISADQVALSRQVNEAVDHANVLEWLDNKRSELDLIISLDLIEHFKRPEALEFLDLCYAALKPGGRVVLQTPNADSPYGLQHRYNDITHEWAFNENQLSRLLRRAGYSDVEPRELGPVPIGYSLSSSARWLLWKLIRSGLQIWNIAETGSSLQVLTRVFLISAKKPL